MDLQTYLDNAVKAGRAESMKTSDQLTLGEIILKIEPYVPKEKEKKEKGEDEAIVVYDFGYFKPKTINSWRGSYAELALDHSEGEEALTVLEFYDLLKETVGKTFTGYKGGDFLMGKNTPVWVANYSESGSTAVLEIVYDDYDLIIMTGYRNYG